ncbi:hypothetical protein C8Q79DRAFT_312626 [Trametes meyenii]|nr:hypothetical protein C8Q79DRAFT_312626 [Trametes meyenii]
MRSNTVTYVSASPRTAHGDRATRATNALLCQKEKGATPPARGSTEQRPWRCVGRKDRQGRFCPIACARRRPRTPARVRRSWARLYLIGDGGRSGDGGGGVEANAPRRAAQHPRMFTKAQENCERSIASTSRAQTFCAGSRPRRGVAAVEACSASYRSCNVGATVSCQGSRSRHTVEPRSGPRLLARETGMIARSRLFPSRRERKEMERRRTQCHRLHSCLGTVTETLTDTAHRQRARGSGARARWARQSCCRNLTERCRCERPPDSARPRSRVARR